MDLTLAFIFFPGLNRFEREKFCFTGRSKNEWGYVDLSFLAQASAAVMCAGAWEQNRLAGRSWSAE